MTKYKTKKCSNLNYKIKKKYYINLKFIHKKLLLFCTKKYITFICKINLKDNLNSI